MRKLFLLMDTYQGELCLVRSFDVAKEQVVFYGLKSKKDFALKVFGIPIGRFTPITNTLVYRENVLDRLEYFCAEFNEPVLQLSNYTWLSTLIQPDGKSWRFILTIFYSQEEKSFHAMATKLAEGPAQLLQLFGGNKDGYDEYGPTLIMADNFPVKSTSAAVTIGKITASHGRAYFQEVMHEAAIIYREHYPQRYDWLELEMWMFEEAFKTVNIRQAHNYVTAKNPTASDSHDKIVEKVNIYINHGSGSRSNASRSNAREVEITPAMVLEQCMALQDGMIKELADHGCGKVPMYQAVQSEIQRLFKQLTNQGR